MCFFFKKGGTMTYSRVLIKISGEALRSGRKDDHILDALKLEETALEIKKIYTAHPSIQIAIVVGAGNIWRGVFANEIGIERATADYMGMLGTIINALALQSALDNVGIATRVMTSIDVPSVAERYIRKRAIRHLEKGRLVIFAGGTGNPYFTTDTTAALRAMEIGADVILMAKNGVDGVYTSDPRVNKEAKFIPHLTYKELIDKNLKVMDQTAASLISNQDVAIRVFAMKKGNMLKVLSGEDIGTTITKE